MALITYVNADATLTKVDVATGASVMSGAVNNGVAGIEAECGGACACATCHVFVDEAWMSRIAPPDATENEMLELVEGRANNSRLSCQIEVSDAIDGLVVNVPEYQGFAF